MTAFPAETKDWTWVLRRRCPECGMDTTGLTGPQVAPLVRQVAVAWAEALTADPDPAARRRKDRWSTLEYGCHVRDVFRNARHRIGSMVDQDDPVFANWDQDAAAVDGHYAGLDPVAVTPALVDAAGAVAARLESLPASAWSRPGRRSDGSPFTVESFARYMVHDPVHHLWDVGRPLA